MGTSPVTIIPAAEEPAYCFAVETERNGYMLMFGDRDEQRRVAEMMAHYATEEVKNAKHRRWFATLLTMTLVGLLAWTAGAITGYYFGLFAPGDRPGVERIQWEQKP